jgi:hypothetical protein
MKPLLTPRRAQQAGLLSFFAAVTVAMTWPLATHMGEHVIAAPYHWDAYTNTMNLGARVRCVTGTGPGGCYDSYYFAPIEDTIAFNENMFGLAPIFAPFYWLSGNPLLAYNAVLLISLTLSAYFVMLLARRLTGSTHAGVIAGIAFAFSPYATFEMGRIQLVATQWIPLTFLFLHRFFETKRLRDMLGFGLAYTLQIGTCLYYAMFMLVPMALIGTWLLWTHRPYGRSFWLRLGGAGAATAALVTPMGLPYFTSRRAFDLTRSPHFAQGFDGKLSFLLNVHPTNRVWTALHHLPPSKVGAHEEIAFPGVTIALLAACAIVVPWFTLTVARPRWRAPALLAIVLATIAGGLALSALSGTLAAGLAVLLVAVPVWRRLAGDARLYPAPLAAHLWLLIATLLLFLGMVVFKWQGEPVRGLYHYLHNYVPGFNGIRKVSRQSIMLMFAIVLVAAFGAAWLLDKVRSARVRLLITGIAAALIMTEFWVAPSPLAKVPAATPALRWIAKRPGDAPIALIPADDGLRKFRGHPGMALHNYLALLHGRRTLNGKSSWIPPVTDLFRAAMRRMPSAASTRILQILGAEYLIVDKADMRRERAAAITSALDKDDNYRRVFARGNEVIYELLNLDDPSLKLLKTPALPKADLKPLRAFDLSGRASRNNKHVMRAFDAKPKTFWGTRLNQRRGEWLDIELSKPELVRAIDFTDYKIPFDPALAFRIDAQAQDGTLQRIYERRRLQIFYDQVHRPRDFFFRVVLPEPTRTRRLRITLLEPVPGRWWTVHEATVWVDANAEPTTPTTPAPTPARVAPTPDAQVDGGGASLDGSRASETM